jgi:hypothetical protein
MIELKSLLDELDELAWDIQDEAEAGNVPWDRYSEAFARARAANSLLFALSPDPFVAATEAAYEANAATNDFERVTVIIETALEG